MTERFVVYSALVGDYDEIQQPAVVDDRFDYILFCNTIEKKQVGVWQIRQIPYSNSDPTRICRYVKTHSEQLLEEYVASLWIDSNIQIKQPVVYNRFIELYEFGIPIATMQHPDRNCIYDEMVSVVAVQLETEQTILQWGKLLRHERYPRNNGLFETNVFYRRHTQQVALMNALWWQCVDKYSKRDQLSCNYVLWKLQIQSELFLPKNQCARNSECFRYYAHKHKTGRYIANTGKETRLFRMAVNADTIHNYDTLHYISHLYYIVYAAFFQHYVANLLSVYLIIRVGVCQQVRRVAYGMNRMVQYCKSAK